MFLLAAATTNYEDAAGKEVLSVVIDARTGAVKNVFHTGK